MEMLNGDAKYVFFFFFKGGTVTVTQWERRSPLTSSFNALLAFSTCSG